MEIPWAIPVGMRPGIQWVIAGGRPSETGRQECATTAGRQADGASGSGKGGGGLVGELDASGRGTRNGVQARQCGYGELQMQAEGSLGS